MNMHSIAWLCLSLGTAAQAAPHRREGALQVRENENIHITTGEPARDRTIFVMLAISCAIVLAFLLGSRMTRLERRLRSRRNLMAPLLVAMYTTVICYIVASTALVSGQGLYTYELCDAGTWVCLVLYSLTKGWVFVFLVERVHVVRAPFFRRSKDKIYLACLIPASVIYTGLLVNAMFWRVTAMHDADGRCHFGITSKASIAGLTVNAVTNVFLTGVFFYLLWPVVEFHGMSSACPQLKWKSSVETVSTRAPQNDSAVQRNIKTLLWKSIIGAILMEIPVAANMIQFLVTGGEELGMMCLALCLGDAFWDALVIHWLTFGSSAAAEKDLFRSTTASSRQALTRHQDSVTSRYSSQREVRDAVVEPPKMEGAQLPEVVVSIRKDSANVP